MLLLLGLLTLGTKTGTAHCFRCLQKWRDSQGIRRGFAGDSRGIRRLFGGFALKMHAFAVSFRGIRSRPLTPFIILKGEQDVFEPVHWRKRIAI